jgi:hypothetical protein
MSVNIAEILIPEPLRAKVRAAPNHWDVYFVSVLLRDGRVFRNLAAREGICITGMASAVESELPFQGEDIVDVEPYYPPLYNVLTFFAWFIGRLIHLHRPENAVPFSAIAWAPRRRLHRKVSAYDI